MKFKKQSKRWEVLQLPSALSAVQAYFDGDVIVERDIGDPDGEYMAAIKSCDCGADVAWGRRADTKEGAVLALEARLIKVAIEIVRLREDGNDDSTSTS